MAQTFYFIYLNMQRLLVIVIILIAPTKSFAQHFAPDGAEWHYTPWCDCLDQESHHFAINAYSTDSIDGFACSTLYWTDIDVTNPDAEIVICENNNQVYFFEESELKLLYDFNLTVGDTLSYHIPVVQPEYDLTCCGDPHDSSVARAIITGISDTIIDGKELIIQNTEPVFTDYESDEYIVWNLGKVIERIGSTLGLFGFADECCLAGYTGEIRCYSDADLFAKFVEYDCVTVGISGPVVTPIEISPTITTASITISIPSHLNPDRFIIINSTNQIVISGTYSNHINVEHLTEGLFYFLLISEEQIIGSGKFITVAD